VPKIGATGFEPATTCTPYRCATKLRNSSFGLDGTTRTTTPCLPAAGTSVSMDDES
jgi:hypothetical protein